MRGFKVFGALLAGVATSLVLLPSIAKRSGSGAWYVQ